jgi:hypothetical protein
LSPSTAAGAIRRLGTPVSERIPALLSSDDFGSSVERAGHGQVLWRCVRAAAGASGERRSDWELERRMPLCW